ncbi:MAG: glycosyltransferase family 4 protein [Elusimicrobiota bacterium]|nr:glycosyltransferase family 4 protein [Elusimicrobiota bacterium]
MNILIMDFERWDSGITSYALASAEALKGRGHKVIFAGLAGKAPVLQAEKRGIETAEISSAASLFALRGIIKDNDVKVLNVHDGKSHALASAAKIICGGLRLIRTYADARPVRKHRFLWKQTDFFISAAEFIKDDFLKKGLPAEKTGVVYQGANDVLQREVNPAVLSGKHNVSIVGRLDPVKGHDTFISAAALVAKSFPDTFFYVIGAEKNVKINQLKALAKKCGVKNVAFTEFVRDAAAYMKSSDIGVIASSGSEAVSRAAVEWMACGKPLVATTAGCLSELVEDGKTGLIVETNNYEAMAAAIEKLLKAADLREKMGRAAQKRAESMFAMEKFAEATENIMRGKI